MILKNVCCQGIGHSRRHVMLGQKLPKWLSYDEVLTSHKRQFLSLCKITGRLQRQGIFLEWGITNGDYQCISDSLESVGKDLLFPTMAEMARTTLFVAFISLVRRYVVVNVAFALNPVHANNT